MSQKVNRLAIRALFPRLARAEHGRIHETALTPNMPVNDAPPLIATGDEQHLVMHLRCRCRHTMGLVFEVDRKHRGEPTLLYVQGQLLFDPSTAPPTMELFQQQLLVGRRFPLDCPAHGRHQVESDSVLAELRSPRQRRRLERGRVGVLVLRRVVSEDGAND